METIEEVEAALKAGKDIKARADVDGAMIHGQRWTQVVAVTKNEIGDKVLLLADGTEWYLEKAYLKAGRK